MTAGTNETGRRASGAWRRVVGTAAAAALLLYVPVTATAEHPGGLPPGQAKKVADQAAPSTPAPAPAAPAPATPAPDAPAPAASPGDGAKTPPGQAKKGAAQSAPPGQAKKAAPQSAPPGQAKKVSAQSAPLRQPTTLSVQSAPPGQAKKSAAQSAPPGQVTQAAAQSTPPGQATDAAAQPTPSDQPTTTAPQTPTGQAGNAGPTSTGNRAAARRRSRSGRTRAGSRTSAAAPVSRLVAVAPTLTTPIATTPTPGTSGTAPTARPHRVATRSAPRARQDNGPVRAVTRTVTRTVRDIAHVIPGWAKALMAALGVLLAVAAALILAAAYRNRRLRAQRAALLADVGALQSALLPIVPEREGALRVSVAYRPAEGLAAGGDFYDVFPLDDDRVGILVGDVSGHGRESLRAATFTRHMVRAYLEAGLGPRDSLQVAGHVVDQHDRKDDFATLVAAVYDPTAGTLSYASAGHPPPIIMGPAAHEPMIIGSSPPLGAGAPTGLRQTTLPLPAGSVVCLFTDGLFEARRDNAILGRKRVAEMVADLGPDATARDLVDRVERDADTIHDDVAVCLIRVDGDATASATVRVEEIEVLASELDGTRVRRFLEAAGIEPSEVGRVFAQARRRAAADGSAILRVRLARDRSGVDVLPAQASAGGAPVAALSARRVATQR